jgi:hypothetical protein
MVWGHRLHGAVSVSCLDFRLDGFSQADAARGARVCGRLRAILQFRTSLRSYPKAGILEQGLTRDDAGRTIFAQGARQSAPSSTA